MLLVDNKVQNLPPGDSTIPKDLMTPLIEDSEQITEMQPSPIAEFRCGISSILVELKCEDLPKVILLSSKFNDKPELKKFFLELVVERYEAEIEVLNSQEKSY